MPTTDNTEANGQLAIPALKADEFFIHTSPEMDALERAAADGKRARNYRNLPQEPARLHQTPGNPYFVRLDLTDAEQMAGAQHEFLQALTDEQDADSALAFLYISRLLAPPSPLPANTAATGKVEFDDVLEKIGWDPRTTAERRAMHKRLFRFIQFAERACVIGERRGKYVDRHTGEVIPTQVRSAIWRLNKVELPEEGTDYLEPNIPLSVGLVMGSEWANLLTKAQTAQYLPLGELLGAIPGNKPSGAWARVIGLALASFWRRLPRESISGMVKPTRRELLGRYLPKAGVPEDVLASPNPRRVFDYWCGAMELLVKHGFIKKEGEALVTVADMKSKYPRKNWGENWLDECVVIVPCPDLGEALQGRALAIPGPIRRKGGRPRK